MLQDRETRWLPAIPPFLAMFPKKFRSRGSLKHGIVWSIFLVETTELDVIAEVPVPYKHLGCPARLDVFFTDSVY